MQNASEPDLFLKISQGDEMAFEKLFRLFHQALCRYAYSLIPDTGVCEEIVQDCFVQIWEKRAQLQVAISIKSYLYKAVYNRCLNHLKHEKVKAQHQQFVMHIHQHDHAPDPFEQSREKELQRRVESTLAALPEECRKVFRLSRQEQLSYKEIAETLDISVKTVENQIGKALRFFRQQLADLLLWALFLQSTGLVHFFFTCIGEASPLIVMNVWR